MVQIVQHDLEFILKQIKIAEAHAAGTPLDEIRMDANGNVTFDPDAPLAISDPLAPYGLRTVDGSYNNLTPGREQWGSSGKAFNPLLDPVYRNEGDDALPIARVTNNNYGAAGSVADADPRIISNLIVDQTLDNPAAVATALKHGGLEGAALSRRPSRRHHGGSCRREGGDRRSGGATLDGLLATHGVEMDGNTVILPNVSPDEGLSASYNGWFTLFGQFFDHGLDLVPKGGNGTVYIPAAAGRPAL